MFYKFIDIVKVQGRLHDEEGAISVPPYGMAKFIGAASAGTVRCIRFDSELTINALPSAPKSRDKSIGISDKHELAFPLSANNKHHDRALN